MTVRRFIHDGADVIQDNDGNGLTTASYLNGPGVDNKLRQTGTTGVLYFTTDHLGSTRALTTAAGTVIEQEQYDSFGNTTGSQLTRYGYTGRERDQETGMLYYRARFYDPQVGRFISEDPAGLVAGINAYAYVGNDPIQWTDASGLCRCGIKEGPEYFVHRGFHNLGGSVYIGGGSIPAGTRFYWHAEFLDDATHDPKCCEVRHLVSWNREPFGPNSVPHPGFPPWARPGQWLEDRNRYNRRYGRRTGPYPSYPDDYHGNEYDSDDEPQRRTGSPAPGFAFRFREIVVDVCNGGRRVYTSKTITVNF